MKLLTFKTWITLKPQESAGEFREIVDIESWATSLPLDRAIERLNERYIALNDFAPDKSYRWRLIGVSEIEDISESHLVAADINPLE